LIIFIGKESAEKIIKNSIKTIKEISLENGGKKYLEFLLG